MKFELLPNSVREKFKNAIRPVIRFFVNCHLHPNVFTFISLLICIFSAIYFGRGDLRLGALMLLIGGFFDMVDGDVARAADRVTRFGALFDSTLDRYAEITVFFGIGYYFVSQHTHGSRTGLLVSMAVFIALAGSIMVSYVRARAEGLGFECKVGLLQRPERILLVALGALISEFTLILAMIMIAIFANLTAIHRMFHIWLADNSGKWKKLPADVDHE